MSTHIPLTPTLVQLQFLPIWKKIGENCGKLQKASKIYQNWVNGLTWNGASLTTTKLNCIMIFKILDYMLRALGNKTAR
jgi:hypothetical protein